MITTESKLAERLGVTSETLAIAAQQQGGVREYLRSVISHDGESRILCRGEGNKGVATAAECWTAVYKEPFERKRRNHG